MSHLPEAMRRIADSDPSIVRIRRIPVGNHVIYHGRNGSMRQGRTSFPALVLKQHEDDGSLDLIVEYEAEDRIWEQRVRPRQNDEEGHCWTLVEPIEPEPGTNRIEPTALLEIKVEELQRRMYGDYDMPEKSMIEYLDDFDRKLKQLEKLIRK